MKEKKNILVFIVDDDPVYSKALEIYLSKEIPGITIRLFPTGEACLHEMSQGPDFVVLDYYLNSEFPYAWDGAQVLKKISWHYPYTTIIMLSAQQDIEVAMNTINEGALEYIVKNEKAFPKIMNTILNVSEVIKTRNEAEDTAGNNMTGLVLLLIVISLFLLGLTT